MLGPDATWGDVRRIYEKSLLTPGRWFEDNILSDPEALKASHGKPDNELIRKPGEFVGGAPKLSESNETDDEAGLGDRVEFSLVIDDDDVAQLLVRIDFEDGDMFYRSDNAWVKMTEDDVFPALDEFPFTRVTGEAAEIWDSSDNRSKDYFADVLLDDRD